MLFFSALAVFIRKHELTGLKHWIALLRCASEQCALACATWIVDVLFLSPSWSRKPPRRAEYDSLGQQSLVEGASQGDRTTDQEDFR
jgi:hypothetical protein